MKVSITTVIEKIKAGDDRYFSVLVNEYSRMLLPIARYHLMSAYNQAKDVEDALQETWTKAYRYLDTLADPLKIEGWLVRILKHECLRIQEKNKKYISMHLLIDPETRDDLLALVHENASEEPEHLNSENIRTVVGFVLKEMDERYALPLKLFYLDNCNLHEIAKMLNISENLIKTRLYRGRQLLKKRILNKIKK